MKILNVVGARPNFMKIAPIVEAMKAQEGSGGRIEHRLVHTGQHYDAKMSDAFFGDLGIPRPDVDLGVGSGSHAEQTGRVMIEFEKVCLREKPDLVIVVGDVNSTMACAITAKKLWVKVAHVEAGLRTGDLQAPWQFGSLTGVGGSSGTFTAGSVNNQLQLADSTSAAAGGAAAGFGIVPDLLDDQRVTGILNPNGDAAGAL